MDKVISARIDESAAMKIGALARQLHTSKKEILERAIAAYAAQIDREQESDVFDRTCGAWEREESAEELEKMSKRAFRKSMQKHAQ